jgi:hypothetical protein
MPVGRLDKPDHTHSSAFHVRDKDRSCSDPLSAVFFAVRSGVAGRMGGSAARGGGRDRWGRARQRRRNVAGGAACNGDFQLTLAEKFRLSPIGIGVVACAACIHELILHCDTKDDIPKTCVAEAPGKNAYSIIGHRKYRGKSPKSNIVYRARAQNQISRIYTHTEVPRTLAHPGPALFPHTGGRKAVEMIVTSLISSATEPRNKSGENWHSRMIESYRTGMMSKQLHASIF